MRHSGEGVGRRLVASGLSIGMGLFFGWNALDAETDAATLRGVSDGMGVVGDQLSKDVRTTLDDIDNKNGVVMIGQETAQVDEADQARQIDLQMTNRAASVADSIGPNQEDLEQAAYELDGEALAYWLFTAASAVSAMANLYQAGRLRSEQYMIEPVTSQS